MTALIDKIDPNRHPKAFFSVLILQKWILPCVIPICLTILVILTAPLFLDSLEALNNMELTEAEEALKNLIVSGVLFMFILYMFGRRH